MFPVCRQKDYYSAPRGAYLTPLKVQQRGISSQQSRSQGCVAAGSGALRLLCAVTHGLEMKEISASFLLVHKHTAEPTPPEIQHSTILTLQC